MYIAPNGKRREGEWCEGKLVHWLVNVEVEEPTGQNNNAEEGNFLEADVEDSGANLNKAGSGSASNTSKMP